MKELIEIELTDEQLSTVTGGVSFHPEHQQNEEQRRHDEDERSRHRHGHWNHWHQWQWDN